MRNLFALFGLLICCNLSQATSVRDVSLDAMAQRAHIIFYGRVTSNESRLDEAGRIATYTQFTVLDLIRGQVGESHTIKQFGGRLPGSNLALEIKSVPKFLVGQEYVVFLAKPSAKGFSSPIGLKQGAFVVRDTLAGKIVGNGKAINKQFSIGGIGLKALAGRPDKAALQDFLKTVRALVRP